MPNDPKQGANPASPMVYQIRLKGHLDSQWADWFEGLTVTLEEDGDTLLTGPVVDQAALFGLLKRVRDLGVPLVSINYVEPGKPDVTEVGLKNSTKSLNKRRRENERKNAKQS
jgi:hypothetical protein